MLQYITPLILTYNEAPNIGRTLEQLGWAREIVVLDSFSDDATLEIIASFPQVRLYQREFDTHENQWNFGLTETGIASEWVLALDADYIVTDDVAGEIAQLMPAPDVEGYAADFIYCINGKHIRSGIYPPVTVLYRRSVGSYTSDGHTHRLVLPSRARKLRAPLLHDDRKPLSRWFAAQSVYTRIEAGKLRITKTKDLSWTDRIRRWRIVAPPAMLLYCLILRGGVFDGWAGFYYAFQRALAELMLSLYLIDKDLNGARKPLPDKQKEQGADTETEISNPQFGTRIP